MEINACKWLSLCLQRLHLSSYLLILFITGKDQNKCLRTFSLELIHQEKIQDMESNKFIHIHDIELRVTQKDATIATRRKRA